jgi:hypothetical protein
MPLAAFPFGWRPARPLAHDVEERIALITAWRMGKVAGTGGPLRHGRPDQRHTRPFRSGPPAPTAAARGIAPRPPAFSLTWTHRTPPDASLCAAPGGTPPARRARPANARGVVPHHPPLRAHQRGVQTDGRPTGGDGSGIGAATACTLAQHGAAVALAARRTDRLEHLAREIARQAAYLEDGEVLQSPMLARSVSIKLPFGSRLLSAYGASRVIRSCCRSCWRDQPGNALEA